MSYCNIMDSFVIIHVLFPYVIINHIYTMEMNGVLGHDSALVRVYWAGDKLG